MIFVSAGHYPAAPGAVYGTFVEHDEAMLWAKRIAELLADRAMLVPTGFLQAKVGFINSRLASRKDMAVEVHFNDATKWVDRDKDGKQDPGELERVGRGSETLYCPNSEKSRMVASLVQEAVASVFQPDRGVKEGWYRMDKTNGPDFFLARTSCPAVIVEPEFVRNAGIIVENRELCCLKIAEALLEAEGGLK